MDFKGEIFDKPIAKETEIEEEKLKLGVGKTYASAKKTKYRKQMKGRNRGLALRGSLFIGEYGLKATDRGRLTARQIEAARRAMTRYIKRGGKIWIRVFPDKPITKKPLEVRQGKGKGNVEYWVCPIQPGKML